MTPDPKMSGESFDRPERSDETLELPKSICLDCADKKRSPETPAGGEK